MTIGKFVKTRKELFWYIKNPENLNNDSIVEHILNYGDWDDVQKLIKIMGIKQVAQIFYKNSSKKRSNYRPDITNYFNLYFQSKTHA